MYFIAKILQASGLVIILIGFVQRFPALMSHRYLLVGVLLFVVGWLTDHYLLKR